MANQPETGQIKADAQKLDQQLYAIQELTTTLNNRTLQLSLNLSGCEGDYPRALEQTAREMQAVGAALVDLTAQTKAYLEQVKLKTFALDRELAGKLEVHK